MSSVLLKCGNKIELNIETNKRNEDGTKVEQKYFSSIYDYNDEIITAYMPMRRGSIILIPNGMEMEMMVHSEKGIYRCVVVVKERYKKGNVFLMGLLMKSKLVKYQRRDYYRCDCIIDFDFRALSTNPELGPISWDTVDDYIVDPETSDIYSGTILDISGGGLRFATKQDLPRGSYLLMSFTLESPNRVDDMLMLGKLLACTKDDVATIYEGRVEFVAIKESEREKIVKFIFQEERRARNIIKG